MRKIKIPFLVFALSLLVTGMAFAVDIPNISTWTQSMGMGGSETGTGDLLIGPLYDVRNLINPDTGEGTTLKTTQQTLINIVNTDDTYGVILRIRFREWKRSLEVLDFDIPISCDGVWVAEVSRLSTGGAIVKSPNRWINAAPTGTAFPSAPFPAAGISFNTQNITEGATADKLARTEYGYFEIIGEEKVVCKMVSDGSWTRLGPAISRDVGNFLMGNTYLIRPEAAISHEYNMNAYSNFAINVSGIWAPPTSGNPTLQHDVQGQGGNPGIGGFDQLEAIMSKRDVLFQYVDGVNDSTPMSTSVVVTFPTKHFHYSHPGFGQISPAARPPFTGTFETLLDSAAHGGEVIQAFIFDRNENILTPPSIPISPGGTTPIPILPWEVNIIGLIPIDPAPDPFARGFRDNVILATQNLGSGQTFTSGWAEIDLGPDPYASGDPRSAAGGGAGVTQGKSNILFNFLGTYFPTGAAPGVVGRHFPDGGPFPGAYRGLPAIGVIMTEFFNNSVNGYYGNTVPWQYDVDFGSVPLAVP